MGPKSLRRSRIGDLALAAMALAAAAGCTRAGPETDPSSATRSAPAVAPVRAGAANVLVIYNRLLPASWEAAKYYARRRGVPARNLLAVSVDPGLRRLDYRRFYEKILTPVRDRLRSSSGGRQKFSQSIFYILLTPGVPMSMNTGHAPAEHPLLSRGKYSAARRSVDQWLTSPEEDFAAGVDPASGKPARISGPMKLGWIRVNRVPLHRFSRQKQKLGEIPVADRKLQDVEFTNEGRLGDLVVAGRQLGEYPVGEQKLGELEVGTKEHPLKLGDVPLRLPHLGSRSVEVRSPLFLRFTAKEPATFPQLRATDKALRGVYLVTRLGRDLPSARRCIDGALYAERHLGAGLSIWLDQKFRFAHDHVAAQARCAALVHSGEKGVFEKTGDLPLGPWRLVIDNQLAEIGSRAKGRERSHRPTASAKVAEVGPGNALLLEKIKFGKRRLSAAAYFCPGWKVRVRGGAAEAEILSVDAAGNRLLLSSVEGFTPGCEVVSTWDGNYPVKNCFVFYGFYGLGRFEDVFAFPPGAIGIHVDSSCMRWARGALGRGVAATYGVVNEPLSAGIPYGDLVLRALRRGNDLAEAMSGATYAGRRWAGVTFADPLYAPFRGKRSPDATAPVIEGISARNEKTGVRVLARLGGISPDQLADVALFRVEYGRDASCGQASDFYSWPQPENPGRAKGRRYSGYSRFCSRLLTGLERGRTYHYRVVTSDPAGNRSTSPTATFAWK